MYYSFCLPVFISIISLRQQNVIIVQELTRMLKDNKYCLSLASAHGK